MAGLVPGIGLMVTFERFPYAFVVNLTVCCFWVSIGVGQHYTDKEAR